MNEIKSEIGEIVRILYYDLQPKKRLQLQRKLVQLINAPSIMCEKSNPGIYDIGGVLLPDPIPYEIDSMGWTKEKFNDFYE